MTVDLTSALFLGLRHPASTLAAWNSLTTGVPAALREPSAAPRLAAMLAERQQVDAGLVVGSTLHALVDVFGVVPRRGDLVALDEACYPLSRWSALVAAGGGATLRSYPHHRADLLPSAVSGRLHVVTDGRCPGCHRMAPLARLRDAAQAGGGVLVVDDSLAFGVLGQRGPGDPFGDGTGTPRWSGIDHEGVVWVASLAKAYGAPLTLITGEAALLQQVDRGGLNRVHSSPPSAADLAAAERALADPAVGARRRRRLLRHVRTVRGALRAAGIPPVGAPFPVVSAWFPTVGAARRRWQTLQADGVRTVVQLPRCRSGAMLSLLVRADHRPEEIAHVAHALRAGVSTDPVAS